MFICRFISPSQLYEIVHLYLLQDTFNTGKINFYQDVLTRLKKQQQQKSWFLRESYHIWKDYFVPDESGAKRLSVHLMVATFHPPIWSTFPINRYHWTIRYRSWNLPQRQQQQHLPIMNWGKWCLRHIYCSVYLGPKGYHWTLEFIVGDMVTIWRKIQSPHTHTYIHTQTKSIDTPTYTHTHTHTYINSITQAHLWIDKTVMTDKIG